MEAVEPKKEGLGLFQLIEYKIQAIISGLMIVFAFVVDQAQIVSGQYEDITIVGLLITAIIVIWKAFNRKDESETKLLKEQISLLHSIIERMEKKDQEKKDMINDLRHEIDSLKRNIN